MVEGADVKSKGFQLPLVLQRAQKEDTGKLVVVVEIVLQNRRRQNILASSLSSENLQEQLTKSYTQPSE